MFTTTEAVEFFVTDLAPGREFYAGALQLPVIAETADKIVFHIPDSRLILTLDADGASALEKGESAPAISRPAQSNFRLVFLVEDVDSAAFHLRRVGATIKTQIERENGLWIFEAQDPYGNRIALAQLNETRG